MARIKIQYVKEGIELGYIDENLMEGERVIARAHLHPIVFLGPIILTIVFLIFGPLVILPLIWVAFVYWNFSRAEFAVTNRRIIAKWGIISRHSVEMNLDKVEGASINQGFLGNMLNYGTIVLNGMGGSREPFPGISNPMAFRQQILEHTNQHLKENIPPRILPKENIPAST